MRRSLVSIGCLLALLGRSADLAVTTGKVLYRPGETAQATVTVPSGGALRVDLHWGLDGKRLLLDKQVAEAGSHELAFAAVEAWGQAVEASFTPAGGVTRTAGAEFGVSDSLWAVGIGHAEPVMTGRDDFRPEELPRQLRAKHSNWIDLFFWAPCDWANLASPLDEWWSGQADYHHREAKLQELIAGCHRAGIQVAAYASCNPAGPFGWEVARRHPEFFVRNMVGAPAGSLAVEHLDRWNDTAWRTVKGKRMSDTGWYALKLDLTRLDTVDYGIDRLSDSVERYGWDAIRFDGHYTVLGNDPLSTRNMRRLKERLWERHPEVALGFNYGRSPAWHGGVSHEMREAMAGGGMYMQEGLRTWRHAQAAYTSWLHYATNELAVAGQIHRSGGHYHCIWNLGDPALTDAQRVYKLVYGLIAGGHPAYGSHAAVPGADWGAFMTRWSEVLWDPRWQPAPELASAFTVSRPGVQWQPLVKSRLLSPTRRQVVVHLVNPPTADAIADGELPAPLTQAMEVVCQPPAGVTVKGAWLIRPETGTHAAAMAGGGPIVVDGLGWWALTVWEWEGEWEVPVAPPRFTEEAVVETVAPGAATPDEVGRDPNLVSTVAPRTLDMGPGAVFETDGGFSGHGTRQAAADAEASNGLAQERDLGQTPGTYPFLGRPWIGPFQPGRYRVHFRLKAIHGSPAASVRLHMRVENIVRNLDAAVLDTEPGFRDAAYHDYPLEVELREPTALTCSLWPLSSSGQVTIRLDCLRVETLERFADWDLPGPAAELPPDTIENLIAEATPAPTREPLGQVPERVLIVRGLWWQEWCRPLTGNVRESHSYSLPTNPYDYDAIVLCNLDATSSDLAARRTLHDWVQAGGRLIVLGGPHTLGQGGMVSTWFERLLPVTLRGPNEVVACQPPLPWGAGVVCYRHELRLREGARLLAGTPAAPLAAGWRLGKGLVTVCLATVMGEAAGKALFWETTSWDDICRQLLYQPLP